mmetsp:Transcript_17718/g.54058  ORF Transcript_17718/g.54058 Transcript_17718/m.54058 type:complete len:309 (+) Transcript_17718:1605-2531(+)
MVAPFFARARNTLTTSSDVAESRPDVGSSANMQHGSATNSKATLTRLRWPPEIPRFSTEPTTECRTGFKPKAAMTSRTRRRRDERVVEFGKRMAAAKSRISVTASSRVMTSSCGTKAVSGAIVFREIAGSPFTKIFVCGVKMSLPDCKRDVHTFSKLDLPAPEGPRIAVALSALKKHVTLSRTRSGRPFEDASTLSPNCSNSMSTLSPRLFTGNDRRRRFSSFVEPSCSWCRGVPSGVVVFFFFFVEDVVFFLVSLPLREELFVSASKKKTGSCRSSSSSPSSPFSSSPSSSSSKSCCCLDGRRELDS